MKKFRKFSGTTVVQWFDDESKKLEQKEPCLMRCGVVTVRKLQKEMNEALRQTISYHDYKEDYYHAFLAGIFAGAGYMVESNKESWGGPQ